ncbi:MAG: hypothetical protein ACI3W9_00090 [Eubacteriales bacterium]
MFKKLLSVITACALLCLCFTVFASAGSSTCSASITYELDNSGVLLVTVTFTDIDDESGVVAVSSNVRFDAEVLEYIGFEQDYPKEWGSYGDSWTCLAENDPSLIKLTYLFDSAEEGHGAQGDFSTVLKFNVLRTGVETVITATENSVTNDLLMMIPAPDVTLTLTVKDGGNVDGDVSVGEASEPESNDTSKGAEESKSEASGAPEASGDSSVEETSGGTEQNGNAVIWIVIGIAVAVLIAAAVIVTVKKKKAD